MNPFVLEKYLDLFRYKGIPTGALYSDKITLINNGQRQSLFKAFYHVLLLIISVFRIKKQNGSHARIIITSISPKMHFLRLSLPIIRHFDKAYIIYNKNCFSQFPDREGHNFTSAIILKARNIPHFLRYTIILTYKLFKNGSRLGLTYSNAFQILTFGLLQVVKLDFYINFFNKKKETKLIITEFDRNSNTSPIILAGKNYGVDSITLVHGQIGAYGYTPVVAESIFCQGRFQKEQLIKKGVLSNRIQIAGSPIIPNILVARIAPYVFSKNIGLAINPVNPEIIAKMIALTQESLCSFSHLHLIIKLHPSQSKSNFESYLEKNSISIVGSNEITNKEFFKKIDVLIIQNSGIGLEAIASGVYTINLKLDNLSNGIYDELTKKNILPQVESSKALSQEISRVYSSTDYFEKKVIKMQSFLTEEYTHVGTKAEEHIIELITKRLYTSNKA